MGNLQGMKGLVLNNVEMPVEIQDMENFQDFEAQCNIEYIVKPPV